MCWHVLTCVDCSVSWSGPKINTSWISWCHQAVRSTDNSPVRPITPSPFLSTLDRAKSPADCRVHYGLYTALQCSAMLCNALHIEHRRTFAWELQRLWTRDFTAFDSETQQSIWTLDDFSKFLVDCRFIYGFPPITPQSPTSVESRFSLEVSSPCFPGQRSKEKTVAKSGTIAGTQGSSQHKT